MIRPTTATLRALLLGVGFALLALVQHRPDLLAVAVPLLLYCVWAIATRPTRDVHHGICAPALAREDTVVPLRTQADLALPLVTVDWPTTTMGRIAPDSRTSLDIKNPDGATAVVNAERWGRYLVGPAMIVQHDSLGAWRHRGEAGRREVVVQPATQVLEGTAATSNPIGVAGAHSSTHHGEGSALAQVREFQAGDRLRRVNWRVTSRTGVVHVNETFTERDTDVLVVVDSLDDLTGADGTSSLDITVRAAVAIARHYLAAGDRVLLHDLGGAFRPLPAGTGEMQARRIIETISRIDRDRRTPYQPRPIPRVRDGALAFVCTPLANHRVTKEIISLRARGASVIVVDAFPHDLGQLGKKLPDGDVSPVPEALRLQKLSRTAAIDQLVGMGIPVTTWRGPSSLGAVILHLQATSRAPRRSLR